MDNYNYLDKIKNCKNYEYALLTTFNFEISFFESFILNSLNNNGIKAVTVYVDGKQLTAALDHVKDSSIGRRYVVSPIHMASAFHPKLFLLLGQNKAKLFVSSANITTSGFTANNEIVNEFIYDADHPENLKIIASAIEFFEKLETISYGLENQLFKEIQQLPYYGQTNENRELFLLNNCERSILEQVKEIAPYANEISIAVPYYDNDLGAIDEICKRYPNATLSLYLQNNKSKFPMEKVDPERFHVRTFRTVKSENDKGVSFESERFYHGKVFQFKTDSASYILYGSANCTRSALAKSFSNGGNIECDVLEFGSVNEFDSFFEGFVHDPLPLCCENLEMEPIKSHNIWFKYGITGPNSIQLLFGYNRTPKIEKVFIEESEVAYRIVGEEVVITLPIDQFGVSSSVFSVRFLSEGETEPVEVKCWILYKDSISIYRLHEDAGRLFSFKLDSIDDEYYQDRIALLQALSLTVSELERENAIRLAMKPTKEPDPEEDDDDESGIIDYTPPSLDVIQQYKEIVQVDKIGAEYVASFRNWRMFAGTQPKHIEKERETEKKVLNDQIYGVRSFDAEDEEGRRAASFVRFAKTKCRQLIDKEYASFVGPDRYFEKVLIFFEMFDRNTLYCSPGRPILFSPKYVAEIKAKLLLILASMELSEELVADYRQLVMLSIVSNHLLNIDKDVSIDANNKKILMSIDQSDQFRHPEYIEYVVSAANMLAEHDIEVNLPDMIIYVDSLFGYKPIDKIIKLLKEDYGQEAEVVITDETVCVNTYVDRLGNYMKIREGSLRELNNYVKAQGKRPSLNINIKVDGIAEGKNPAVQIVYSAASLPSSTVKQKIIRRNGKIEEMTMSIMGAD